MAITSSGKRAAGCTNRWRQPEEAVSKIKQLRRLTEAVLNRDSALLDELLRQITHLQSDNCRSVRRFVARVIGEVGSKHSSVLPELMPSLVILLADGTPAVMKRAITTGSHLFQTVLVKLVFQVLYSNEAQDPLQLSWEWLLKFKDLVFSMAFQATGDEEIRLRAVKFATDVILLYTPDPNICSDPPLQMSDNCRFNVLWLRRGHPFLNIGDLAMEASQNLILLLDQLKFPQVKLLSGSMIKGFINSLIAIAQRRPAFYGKILPVLLDLNPSKSLLKEVQSLSVFQALRNAYSECLKCTHSTAEPWCARLMQALKAMDSGEAADSKVLSGGIPSYNDTKELSTFRNEGCTKRRFFEEMIDGASENRPPSSKRVRQDTVKETEVVVSVNQLRSMFPLLEEQGKRAANSLEVLSSSISSELLADIVLANMHNLPPARPGGDKDDNGVPDSDMLSTFTQLASLFQDPNLLGFNSTATKKDRAQHLPAEQGRGPGAASSLQFVSPIMHATKRELTKENKDRLQREAFVRIIESDEQLLGAGGIHMRMSLLPQIGVKFLLELNPWEVLQKYVISDYVERKGHELIMRVLYRLYLESQQSQDSHISSTATSIYESFLVTVAEALLDKFPASDKSLNKLFVEVPFLPEGALKLLQGLCSPSPERSNAEKHDKETPGGDRITQGLSCIWSLIVLRPVNRDRCLHIAFESAVHPLEEVRMKAIRLIANKLYSMVAILKRIEDFATEKLRSVVGSAPATDEWNADSQKDPVLGISEAQQCMSLYFALCTKRHNLLHEIFVLFGDMIHPAKQVVHEHIPLIVRSISTSSDLLGIISDPPSGSERLVMKALTDGLIPSRYLISAIKKLYAKLKDVDVIIPVLAYLPKEEILPLFPNLVNLPMDKLQTTLSHMLPAVPQSASSLTPSEVLKAIHNIEPEKDGVPLKKVMEALSACFELKTIFTQQVLAKALNLLVEQIPLPFLFMRTVIQAIGVFPGLADFSMEIMSRLVKKQVWNYPQLWTGFVKHTIHTKPHSFGVLLQVPVPQLANALSKYPILKGPLVEYASQPHIRSTLPRSLLVVLGLLQDRQPPDPT